MAPGKVIGHGASPGAFDGLINGTEFLKGVFPASKAEVKEVEKDVAGIKADAAQEKLLIQAIVDKVNSLTPVSAQICLHQHIINLRETLVKT